MYHSVVPHRDEKSGKIAFPLTPMVGTCTHVELQLAKIMGYRVDKVFVQRHFPQNSTTLFRDYIDTFFEIKQQAQTDGSGDVILPNSALHVRSQNQISFIIFKTRTSLRVMWLPMYEIVCGCSRARPLGESVVYMDTDFGGFCFQGRGFAYIYPY